MSACICLIFSSVYDNSMETEAKHKLSDWQVVELEKKKLLAESSHHNNVIRSPMGVRVFFRK